DVGVGEQHAIDRPRIERKPLVVQRLQALGALEHAAIDEELRPRRLQPKAGAGDAAGGAVDGEGDAHRLSSMRRTASARIGASGAALVWWAIESVETIVRAPAAFTRPVASGVIKAWATATSIEAAPARFAAATARTNVSRWRR